MFDWWTEQPAWLRVVVSLGMIAGGALVFWFVHVRVGIAMFGVGAVMLLIGGKTDAEKKGYRF